MLTQLERRAAERGYVVSLTHNDFRRLLVAGAPYFVAALITILVALYMYTPWRADGAVVWPSGDSLAFHSWIKTVTEYGWYEHDRHLAAPYGQNNHHYFLTDELLFLVIGKLLAPLAGGFAGGVLLYVVIGFPLAAVAAVAVARYLKVSRTAAVLVGVAYALLPDHLMRTTGHFSLTSQWAIPVGVLAAVSVLPAPRRRRHAVQFELLVVIGCVAVSLANAYYTIFITLMLAGYGIISGIATVSWHPILRMLTRCAALLAPLSVALIFDSRSLSRPLGHAATLITRAPGESEAWAGKITAMLLPSPAHRFELFRQIRERYSQIFDRPAEEPALAMIASAGFIFLVIWSLSALIGSRQVRDQRLNTLAVLNWIAVLIFTVGGAGSMWSLLLNGGGIRVWSRAHVLIAFIALLGAAVVIDRIPRLRTRTLVAAGLVIIALIDQTSPAIRPNLGASRDLKVELTALTSRIAAMAGSNASIFQMPVIGFPLPDRDTGDASPYDGFLPHLYSPDLQWSYGGYQGDPRADWQQALNSRPLMEQVASLKAAGFQGILVDNRIPTGTETAGQLNRLVGPPDVTSYSGRWQYFSINSIDHCASQETSEIRDATLEGPFVYAGEGLWANYMTWFSESDHSALRLLTLREEGWPKVSVTIEIKSSDSSFEVTFPDGLARRIGPGDGKVEWAGELPEKEAIIELHRTSGSGLYTLGEHTARAVLSAASAQCLSSHSG